MECLSPITVKQNGGFVHVPCGKCVNCYSRKRADWFFRISQELKSSSSALFLTLTYSDEYLPSNGVSVRDVQLFLKRFRRELSKYKQKVSEIEEKQAKFRYFIVSEYIPDTKRPHYHGILFNVGRNELIHDMILRSWRNGFIYIGSAEPASINYTAGYIMQKSDVPEGKNKLFMVCSRRPAIGFNYLIKAYEYHRKNKSFFTCMDGIKTNLPRYYQERIFNRFERDLRRKKLIKEIDKKKNEKFEKLQKLGNNPFDYELKNKEQLIERVNKKITKKGKL